MDAIITLCKFLKNLHVIKLSGINGVIALDFLMSFESFENYLLTFYNLEYKKVSDCIQKNNEDKNWETLLVNAMLAFGDMEIKTPDDLENYMDLAIAYWTIQRHKYEEKKPKYVLNNIIVYSEEKETNATCQNTKS